MLKNMQELLENGIMPVRADNICKKKKVQAQKVWLYSIIRGDSESAFVIQENQKGMSRTKESKYSHNEP